MPRCGSQIILCDLPVRFDTYKGCSHGCKYCFALRNGDNLKIEPGERAPAIRKWIAGKRNGETAWCDWDIPLHWGGMSDPFQPVEKEMRISFECLKVFAETGYPFVVSTKGTGLLVTAEYLELLKRCNCVVQVSLVSPQFDALEPGAPSFEERLADLAKIAPCVKRVIIRVQPYVHEVFGDLLQNIPRYAASGVYGITIEGIKYFQKRPGFVKCGADFVYPRHVLERDFLQIRDKCRESGLHFFCAENRLRSLGESLCCCGIAGLDGFRETRSNLIHFVSDGDIKYTDRMQTAEASCFKALSQDTQSERYFKKATFATVMDSMKRDKKVIEGLI